MRPTAVPAKGSNLDLVDRSGFGKTAQYHHDTMITRAGARQQLKHANRRVRYGTVTVMGSPRSNRSSQLARRRGLFDSSVGTRARSAQAASLPTPGDYSAVRPFALAAHRTETHFQPVTGFYDQLGHSESTWRHITYHTGSSFTYSVSPWACQWPVQVILHRHGNVDMMQLNLKNHDNICVQRGINDAVNIVLN